MYFYPILHKPIKRIAMKKILTFSLMFLLVLEAVSQVRAARRRHYNRFFESTTYMVKDQDPFSKYNEYMIEAMEKHWHITPFEVITFEQFEQMRTNEDASFLIYANIKQKNLDQIYEFINFVMGDRRRDFEGMPDLGSVPLAYRDGNDLNYLYKMGAFVKFMQTFARERSSTSRIQLARILNVRDEALRHMQLWLLEEELAPEINTLEKIQNHYPYPVRIATREEIRQAVDENRSDVALLHKIGPEDVTRSGRGKCWKFIIAADDGRVLYSNSHDVTPRVPDALLLSDLEEIAK